MEADAGSLTTAYLGDQEDRGAHVPSRGGACVAYSQVLCVDNTKVHGDMFLGYHKGDGQGHAKYRELHMGGDDEAPRCYEEALHLASWRRVGQDQEVPGRAEEIRSQALGGDQGFREMDLECNHRATSKGDSEGCKASSENGKVGVEIPHSLPPKVYSGGGKILLEDHRSNCRMGVGHHHRSGPQSVSNGLPRHHRCSRKILGVVREHA